MQPRACPEDLSMRWRRSLLHPLDACVAVWDRKRVQSIPSAAMSCEALYEGGDLRRVHGTRQLPNGWVSTAGPCAECVHLLPAPFAGSGLKLLISANLPGDGLLSQCRHRAQKMANTTCIQQHRGLFYYHEIPKGGVQNGRTQWQFPDLQAESWYNPGLFRHWQVLQIELTIGPGEAEQHRAEYLS